MTQTELLSEFDRVAAKLRETLKAKNDDYSGASEDGNPFANFTACERLGLCSAEVGFLVRMQDKWQRLKTLSQKGKLSVEGESGLDACLDIMGYAFLLLAYLKHKGAV